MNIHFAILIICILALIYVLYNNDDEKLTLAEKKAIVRLRHDELRHYF